ncbi:2-oxoglutarate (2OG) and Fe(II)-dependent oxygenase superfamily protein [Striga hermonthica]|uniref:2-oxoglutarate (2OG) and Fe(II)-dependent oxygenase superfamily protein n=1 Tax=Striga hermonthica TaxID=68872 RepID=A0A9N7RB20_STRHE|nr:2-oxoglutarate (2OG) and Fe(II)-dependent oxygenase superfamily protein [Striga hermonthica]
MAENLYTSVQELVENGVELPAERYIWRDSHSSDLYDGPLDPNPPLTAQIPVIDVAQLCSSSSAMDAQLRSALESWGCFQAVNHGMDNSFLDEVRRISREFFHLPKEEKQKYARAGDDYEGYGNDLVLFENQPLDWTDRLYLLVSPDDRRKLQYWPENPESFREMFSEYIAKMRQLQGQLLKSAARSLGLSEDAFVNVFGERGTMYTRFNYYPPCSRPDLVLGLKPHADGSGITILLQDKDVKGLQLLRDDKWFWVPIMPHALVVNIGDQLEIISNGIFISPIHRAVTNPDNERNTLAVFCSPDPDKDIQPLEELVDEQNPSLFKKVRDYPSTYFNYYQQGKRPLNAVRI